MALTFLEAKKTVAQYAGKGGKCHTSPEAYTFLKEVLQYMLYSGQYGNKRKFCFHAINGCFTVPYELEVPMEVKIDDVVGNVWNKWFEFYPSSYLTNCVPAEEALYEESNYFPTVYDLPTGGSKVAVLGTAFEDIVSHVIVQGVDTSGREVFTTHKGEKVSGEYLSIEKDKIKFGTVTFGKITGVTKTKTNGYVQLLSVDTSTGKKIFLSDYSPLEETPQYRRFRLRTGQKGACKVSILGKIRIKNEYSDNDIIPFDNLSALKFAAQSINAHYNNNVEVAGAKDQAFQSMVERENSYKKVQSGQPIKISKVTSTGLIKNII